MKHQHSLIVVALIVCAALVGTVAAQGNKPDVPEAAVTTKFTYQAKISREAAPFNGLCDVRFTLWDAASAGAQVATYTPPTQVEVKDSVIAVEVDFGAQFKGQARWIQAEIKCASDANYQALPRENLNPTPYAIGLMPGAQIEGNIASTMGVLGVANNGAGAALTGIAYSASGTTYGVLGNAFSPNGYAVWGYASGGATGVQGVSVGSGNGVNGSTSAGKAGVYGLNTNATSYSVGVMGVSDAANTYGVYGGSVNGTGIWGKGALGPGVVGASDSHIGVWGDSLNYDAIWGIAHAANKIGVLGRNDAGTGVWGASTSGWGTVGDSIGSAGVRGHSTNNAGVEGESDTLDGVRGVAHAAAKVGVLGRNNAGIGVYGESSVAHTYDLAGVSGVSLGNGGIGVKGTANTGAGSYGVYGVAHEGYGVVGQSQLGYAGYFIGKVGITGADLAERFAAVDDQPIEPGTVVVVDDDQAGKIRASDRAYDSKVVGIISGAGGIRTALLLHQDDVLQGDLVVAIAGRVYCKAEANSAPIKPGDLLTTSSIKGHCMKATDRDQAYGAVIGKALTGLDKGEGLVLVLVNLQ